MSNHSRKWILLLGACILCSTPLYATNTEYTNTRGEKPPVTKPQTKPEVKPETKPAPTPSVKPETKPAPTPSVKPEVKPAPTPSVKPEVKPAPTPSVKPETKPAPTPSVKPETKPAPTPCPKPETKPTPVPCPKPVVKPAPTPNCKETGYYKNFEKAMASYEETTSKLQPSGFVDVDFLEEMIPHHGLGISMAENILKTTKNDEVKGIATSIVESQKAQSEQMTKLEEKLKTKNCKCDKNASCANEEEAKYLAKYKEINESMIKKMKALAATCNDDVDFIAEMIPHHEGAAEMAQNILEYSHNRTVKKIAKNIVKEQQAQIKQMQTLLATLKK